MMSAARQLHYMLFNILLLSLCLCPATCLLHFASFVLVAGGKENAPAHT
jgi:hypothetical protein